MIEIVRHIDPNEYTFEEAMKAGMAAHADGAHKIALNCRQIAFYNAQTPVEQARALRDGAASLAYLDRLDEAGEAAETSVTMLEVEDAGGRELAASYDRLARVRTLTNMQAERSGMHVFNPARSYYDKALGLLELRDQYRTNMLSRVATAEALYGTRSLAVVDSIRAAVGALRSETRSKHLTAAGAALAVSLTVKSPHKDRSNTRSFALAKRLMH